MNPVEDRCWPALLDCAFGVRNTRTVLIRLRFNGPLRVQRLFYPEQETAHCYLLHPPGGLVSGDALEMRFRLEPQAHCLLTTPSAGKIYRMDSRQSPQRQTFAAEVNNSILEWLPQETIVFNGAGADLSAQFYLKGKSRLITCNVTSFGRAAANESFTDGHFSQSLRIAQDDVPLLLERTDAGAQDMLWDSPAGHMGTRVCATFIACGRNDTLEDEQALRRACKLLQDTPQPEGARTGVTYRGGALLARYLGQDSAEAQRFCRHAWRVTRPLLLGKEACPPRIWNT